VIAGGGRSQRLPRCCVQQGPAWRDVSTVAGGRACAGATQPWRLGLASWVPAGGAACHQFGMVTPPKSAGPAPGRAQLHEAALRHLARFAATEVGLVRVLERRLLRWARLAEAEGRDVQADLTRARAEARGVAASLVGAGVVNDANFAAARTGRLVRAGRSRRAIAAHLAAKGVQPDVADANLPEGEREVHAALMLARRRRLGPFRANGDEDLRLQELGVLARAGFSREVAERVLDMPANEADVLVMALRRG
jgi:regulatory protein